MHICVCACVFLVTVLVKAYLVFRNDVPTQDVSFCSKVIFLLELSNSTFVRGLLGSGALSHNIIFLRNKRRQGSDSERDNVDAKIVSTGPDETS